MGGVRVEKRVASNSSRNSISTLLAPKFSSYLHDARPHTTVSKSTRERLRAAVKCHNRPGAQAQAKKRAA